jgi:methyl-accepting chemotaxis protein
MKIGVKLNLVFASFVLFFSSIAGVTIVAISGIRSLESQTYANSTYPLSILLDLSVDHQKVRVEVRDILLDAGKDAERAGERRIRDLLAGIGTLESRFGQSLTSEAGRAVFEGYRELEMTWVANVERLLTLAKDGRFEEARAFLYGTLSPASERTQLEIAKLVQDKSKLAESFLANAGRLASAMSVSALIALGVAVALSLYMANFVYRTLTAPLLEAIALSGLFASGSYEKSLSPRNLSRRDEVGELARALEVLAGRRAALDAVVKRLLVAETLSGAELKQIVESTAAERRKGNGEARHHA